MAAVKARFSWEWILLGVLMVGVAALRIYHLPEYPYHVDEGLSIRVMQNIIETGRPLVAEGSIYWRSLLGQYLMAIPLFFMDVSPYSTRLVSVLFGSLMLPLAYLMGRSADGRAAGWLAALFLAFSTYENLYASMARFYILFQFFFVLAVYFAGRYFILRRPHSGRWLIVATLGAIGTHKLSLELLIVFALAAMVGKGWDLVRSRPFLLGCLVVSVFAYLNLFWKPSGSFMPALAIPLNIGAVSDKLAFFKVFRQFVPYGMTLLILALLPLWHSRQRILLFFSLVFLVCLAAFSLVAPEVQTRYICNLFPIGVMVAAASLCWWARALAGAFRSGFTLNSVSQKAVLVLVAVAALGCLVTWENRDLQAALGRSFKFLDQKTAHDIILGEIGPKDLVISMAPILTEIYLGRPADFFIREKRDPETGRFSPFTEEEKKSGFINLIDSPKRLREVLGAGKHRVWLYANHKIRFTVSNEMRGLIQGYFLPKYVGENSYVFLKP